MVAIIERSLQLIKDCEIDIDLNGDVHLVEFSEIKNRIDSAIVGFVGTSDPTCFCKEVPPMFSSACDAPPDVTENPPPPAPDFD